ncbi:MAG: hypothetical protein ACRC20_03430 [Segniliparus sp.]|uniref:hypothetical protein n=1 Tax=Segniliparus sp. TaxID=2804064 RepID=UPI003F40E709
MDKVMKTIAKAASVAAFGMFVLTPAMASAAPAAQSVVVAHMADSSSGDSHGHNSNQLPQPRVSNDQSQVHLLPPASQR